MARIKNRICHTPQIPALQKQKKKTRTHLKFHAPSATDYYLLDVLSYQNHDEKSILHLFKIWYNAYYHPTRFQLTPLAIKKGQILKGRMDKLT